MELCMCKDNQCVQIIQSMIQLTEIGHVLKTLQQIDLADHEVEIMQHGKLAMVSKNAIRKTYCETNFNNKK